MQLSQASGQVLIPNGGDASEALRRTTHLGVGAHPDDLEIMAWHGILSGRQHDQAFTGVVVADGAQSPRAGRYAGYTDQQMRAARLAEQGKAAAIGQYAAVVYLGFTSAAVKQIDNAALVCDLTTVLQATRPQV